MRDEIELLREEISHLNQAANHLEISIERCVELSDEESVDDMEKWEAFTSRFARLADMLTQRVMRLVDELELLPGSSLLDRIFQAEKRGWVCDADQLIQIRKLRNNIAHDYAAENRALIHDGIKILAPELLVITARASQYAENLIRRLEARR